MPIQAVLFPKHFTIHDMRRFLREHKLHAMKPPHETARFKRVRILEPNFKSYSTTKLPSGVDLVIGYD